MKIRKTGTTTSIRPVVLSIACLLMAGLISACQSQGSQLTFTAGNIAGDVALPIYPGAVQSTEGVSIAVPKDMTPGVAATEWRRYITDDNPDQVLAWYAQALPEAGFSYKGVQNNGAVFFLTGNWRYGMIVVADQGKTNIIIAAGHE
jgi:hypothetical protein